MKKLFILIFLLGAVLCLGLLSQASDTLAFTMPAKVRVGLEYKYKEAASVPIQNKLITIGYEQNGSFQNGATLIAGSAFTIAADNLHYVKVGQNFTSYEEAAGQLGIYFNMGYHPSAAFLDTRSFAVYIGGYGTKAEADAAALAVGGVVMEGSSHRTVLMDGSNIVIVFDNPVCYPQVTDGSGDALSLGDRKYRGAVEFDRLKNGKITAVNVLTVDEYLVSVVPSEMPAGWNMEALKAQAVSARSYTITQMGVHNEQGYHLCDQVHCQSYLGAGNESQSTTTAVKETSGVMVYFNGEPINASYFSSSGGVTENSDNVWPNALPYLRSVKEISETTFKEWNRTFTLAELTQLVNAKGLSIGNVAGVSIGAVEPGGRVKELVLKGTSGSKSLYKEEIRTFFSGSAGGKLESKNFVISNGSMTNEDIKVAVLSGGAVSSEVNLKGSYAVSNAGTPVAVIDAVVSGKDITVDYKGSKSIVTSGNNGNSIVFSGKGWGHGVGMSQYGAKGMAETGYTYKQILEYYYTGVEVR